MQAPSNKIKFTSVTNTNSTVTLNWTAVADIDGYVLTRQTASGPFSIVAYPSAGQISYTDTDLVSNTSYTYDLIAFNKCGDSPDSYITVNTNCITPQPVFSLNANALSETVIQLSWSEFDSNDTFLIENSPDNVTWTTVISGYSSNVYNFITTEGLCFYFKVTAINCGIHSAATYSSMACTACYTPGVPPSVSATALSETTIQINWGVSSNSPTSYSIQRNDGGSWIIHQTVSSSTFTWTDIDLVPNTNYCYRVFATNACGAGSPSTSYCVNTLNAPACNSDTQTFNWAVPSRSEPGYFAQKENSLFYLVESSPGIIDVTNPMITAIQFSQDSILDDILVLMKPSENVIMTYTDSSSSSSNFADARGNTQFIFPNNCILFSNTGGFYINGQSFDGYGNLVIRNTLIKDCYEAGTTHHYQIVAGQPPGTPNNTGDGVAANFVSAGFTVYNFVTPIPLSVLNSKGFITTNGSGQSFFNFKFAHIVCGTGYVTVDNLTCYTGNPSSSSSSTCSTQPSVTLSGSASGGNLVSLSWTDISDPFGYQIQREVGSSGFINYDTVVGETTYIDEVTAYDLQYCYQIVPLGCTSEFNGSVSNTYCVTLDGPNCPTDCTACCCTYTFVISSGSLAGTYMLYKQSVSDCTWSTVDGIFPQSVIFQDSGNWVLQLNNSICGINWTAPCNYNPNCPPTSAPTWSTSQICGSSTPVFTLSVSNCGGCVSSSSSATFEVCNFTSNAAGGDAGYSGSINVAPFFSSSSDTTNIYFYYNTYNEPDKMELYANSLSGTLLYASPCVGTRELAVAEIPITAYDSPLYIHVIANCNGFTHGTGWEWHLTCNTPSSSSSCPICPNDCSACCLEYDLTVSGSTDLNGTYSLTVDGNCGWSGSGSQSNTSAAIMCIGDYWQLQVYCNSCSYYWQVYRCPSMSCPPLTGWTEFAQNGSCATPSISFTETMCSSSSSAGCGACCCTLTITIDNVGDENDGSYLATFDGTVWNFTTPYGPATLSCCDEDNNWVIDMSVMDPLFFRVASLGDGTCPPENGWVADYPYSYIATATVTCFQCGDLVLWNTGQNIANAIGGCDIDQKWTYNGLSAVAPSGGSGAYYPNGGVNWRWITAQCSFGGVNYGGGAIGNNNHFQTTINIPFGTDLSTFVLQGEFGADNSLINIIVNGTAISTSYFITGGSADFESLHPFTIPASANWIIGNNNVEFQVNDGGSSMGLQIVWDYCTVPGESSSSSSSSSSSGPGCCSTYILLLSGGTDYDGTYTLTGGPDTWTYTGDNFVWFAQYVGGIWDIILYSTDGGGCNWDGEDGYSNANTILNFVSYTSSLCLPTDNSWYNNENCDTGSPNISISCPKNCTGYCVNGAFDHGNLTIMDSTITTPCVIYEQTCVNIGDAVSGTFTDSLGYVYSWMYTTGSAPNINSTCTCTGCLDCIPISITRTS